MAIILTMHFKTKYPNKLKTLFQTFKNTPKTNSKFSIKPKRRSIYFLNKNWPRKIEFGKLLLNQKGIGKTQIIDICKKLNISRKIPIYMITNDQFIIVEDYLNNNLIYYGRYWEKKEIEHLVFLYQTGLTRIARLKKGLPTRGQRTITNAKTVKRRVARKRLNKGLKLKRMN